MGLLRKTVREEPAPDKSRCIAAEEREIPADTYVLDLDMIVSNGAKIKAEATRVGLQCYLCAKQFGRNPIVVDALRRIGFEKAMGMDIEGIKNLHRYGTPIAHVGHFGQIPSSELEFVLSEVRPEVFTVYSMRGQSRYQRSQGGWA